MSSLTARRRAKGDAPLRVLLTVDPNIPVPPTLYGGIERIVDFLVRQLVQRGHEVTLFANPASRTGAHLVPYGVPPHRGMRARATELAQVGWGLWTRRNEADVIHSFGRLAALLPVLPLRDLPKIQSYQRDVVPWDSVRTASRLAGDSLRFTGCSTSVYALRPAVDGGTWHTVFNGVDTSKYDATQSVPAEAPLVFLGRLERMKGAHSAIRIARESGRRLVIAGNRVDGGDEPDYFEREIAPHVDGELVRYVGPVNDAQKNALLGGAAALLMPIEWEEPFGIVMAEALACGTPVVGFRRGSVPEVVRDGVNGFACDTAEEAIALVPAAVALDRAEVRRDCEARFSDRVIADAYVEIYRGMLDARARSAA
ncbi:MAG TPA: glycosyltransferase [Gemmatimonadaceae bacterium]|nr:glycosyltransferase [Gemmatimonadaceae bacterium]